MQIKLSNDILNKSEEFQNYISQFTVFPEVFYESGKEHYRLLAYLSMQFNNELLLDVGARYGYSAIALSLNQHNKVISYNIKNELQLNNLGKLKNLEFSYEDDITKLSSTLQSKIIMLDVDPHDGIYETRILLYLKENNWNGLLIFDDTRQDLWPNIYNIINNEYDINQIDATQYGHFSGTTILNFNNNIEFILE